MRYYIPQDYTEHYVVPFSDVDGNEWKVSIQEPNYHGTPVTLVGAAEPIEWMGRGDEDQTEVILGSTGTLRLVRTGDTDIYFQKNSLLPTYINDRRVQVFMIRNGELALFWQGFILPESFSQDWDATPSEVELPLVSVVAALEYFPLPLKEENDCYTYFASQTNIAGLLRAIFIWSGCEIFNLVTNKPIYEDFNGQTQSASSGGEVHWTQGKVSSEYFYERENGVIRPKTFKDMLETLTYPYGKVQDYAYDVCILMRWMDDANEDSKLYAIPVWGDYDEQEWTNDYTFSEYTDIPYINLTDIATESTDNTQSEILAPTQVKFSVEPDGDAEIFALKEDYIKPTLPLPATELPQGMENVQIEDGPRRFLYAINEYYVNKDFADDWEITAQSVSLKPYYFCRVVDVTVDNSNKLTSDLTVPLGLCFNLGNPTIQDNVEIGFTIAKGVRTRPGATLAKLSLKCYSIFHKEPYDITDDVTFAFYVQDTTKGLWMYKDSSGDWTWGMQHNIELSDLNNNSGTYELYFNELRDDPNDVLPHKLRLIFDVHSISTLSGNTYGRTFIVPTLEYTEHCFAGDGIKLRPIPSGTVMAIMSKNIGMKRTVLGEESGDEELDIELKTMAGNKNIVINNSVTFPFNSFCDATKYIDTVARKKIEIEAAKSEPLYWGGYDYYLAAQYAVVKDGYKVFIPVAVGMNPRMSTLRLTLVSTNVNAS